MFYYWINVFLLGVSFHEAWITAWHVIGTWYVCSMSQSKCSTKVYSWKYKLGSHRIKKWTLHWPYNGYCRKSLKCSIIIIGIVQSHYWLRFNGSQFSIFLSLDSPSSIMVPSSYQLSSVKKPGVLFEFIHVIYIPLVVKVSSFLFQDDSHIYFFHFISSLPN